MERNSHEAFPVKSLPPNSPFLGSSLIPILNKLQDIFSPLEREDSQEFNLPQVAVVGSQSSGKSSVLEALVGRDFLPRGCDICTRCPILLQLQHRSGSDEWGEFRHLPGKKFYDFSDIRSEIEVETRRRVGQSNGVSTTEIGLRIFSPNVLDITLVDLPGMTKVPVGNQPSDIEAMIRNLLKSYITQENCIILAVSPANSDLATSDALQIAMEVDPTGSRTIGVITKLDIMDRGTDACKFLLGKVVPLRLGYVGVVNRSQEDIQKNRSIKDAFAYEDKFFQEHPIYNGVSDRCGVQQLAKKLNQVLEQHIRNVLPNLKAELDSHVLAVTEELKMYGDNMESMGGRGAILSNILTRYCEAISCMVDGTSQEMSIKKLSGGARIKNIFHSSFVKCLEEIDPWEDMADEDIRIGICNATGLRNTLFVPEVPFENMARRQIAKLLKPSLQCLRSVHEELISISYFCEPVEMLRFPILRKRMSDILKNFLHEGVKEAEGMIENLLHVEMSYINSSHPDFIGGRKAMEMILLDGKTPQLEGGQPQSYTYKAASATAEIRDETRPNLYGLQEISNLALDMKALQLKKHVYNHGFVTTKIRGVSSVFVNRRPSTEISVDEPPMQTQTMHDSTGVVSETQLVKPRSSLRLPETLSEDETVDVLVTKLLVTSYYDIVKKNVQDLVPKSIMHFLVNYTKKNLLGTLMQTLYRENLFEDLLREEDDIAMKRKKTNQMLRILHQAVQTLDEVVGDVCLRKFS